MLYNFLGFLFWVYVIVLFVIFIIIEAMFMTMGIDRDLTPEQQEYAKRWNNCRKHWEAFKIAAKWPVILVNGFMDDDL